jgi:hypothetical protein
VERPFKIDRSQLYHFPWTLTDNPGGWIEVTDICNMKCPGCFRHTLSGHRSLQELKEEVIQLSHMTNCSRISIAGGEPLLYPDILEMVAFISGRKLKPIILSNGELLTEPLVKELRRAGLHQFYFHVDSNQNRKDWQNGSELNLNELRQHYADLVNSSSRIKCGFLTTVTRSSLGSIPDVLDWFYKHPGKVIHMAFIAFRAIPIRPEYVYRVNGREIDPGILPNTSRQTDQIDITTEDMYAVIRRRFPNLRPSAYLGGTGCKDSYKFLIINSIGSRQGLFGSVGARTIALQQKFTHLLSSHYSDTVPRTGREIFMLAPFDSKVRKALLEYIRRTFRHPGMLFQKVGVQSLVLQQPFEFINGNMNLCDGCINMMIHQGQLIHSCQLDEYRMMGGELSISLN